MLKPEKCQFIAISYRPQTQWSIFFKCYWWLLVCSFLSVFRKYCFLVLGKSTLLSVSRFLSQDLLDWSIFVCTVWARDRIFSSWKRVLQCNLSAELVSQLWPHLNSIRSALVQSTFILYMWFPVVNSMDEILEKSCYLHPPAFEQIKCVSLWALVWSFCLPPNNFLYLEQRHTFQMSA